MLTIKLSKISFHHVICEKKVSILKCLKIFIIKVKLLSVTTLEDLICSEALAQSFLLIYKNSCLHQS